jgi:hypothetical protein
MTNKIQVGFLLLLLLAPASALGAVRVRRAATCTGSNPVPRLQELPLL